MAGKLRVAHAVWCDVAHTFRVSVARGLSCAITGALCFLLLLSRVLACVHTSHNRHTSCFENTSLPGATTVNLRNIIVRDRLINVKANKHC